MAIKKMPVSGRKKAFKPDSSDDLYEYDVYNRVERQTARGRALLKERVKREVNNLPKVKHSKRPRRTK